MITLIKILLFSLVNISFIIFFKKLSHIFNLYDHPNLKRKRQVEPISLLGGFIFLVNFDLFAVFEIYTNDKIFFENLGLNTNIKISLFLIIFNLIY